MPYVINATGWNSVSDDFQESELSEGETLVSEIPQWFYERLAAAEEQALLMVAENAWREQEIGSIANQLMALEESEATGEAAGALPGTRSQWLSYRTKVRAWKEGAEGFPDSAQRPARPE
ncbi:hypothetical protein [Pseudomonas fluorescens]|jgi:hypothetical protein|uniref:Phage tail protein n=1 Tax=Pseudomonas fluorescens TaxID=294 RepID=A0A5E7HXV3_PSEFL|nr:hypothetical protein [Pseudomonas fluorescens]VVO68910.1 hypothetical protein PS847_01201 [Pseudomonas fluorescens]